MKFKYKTNEQTYENRNRNIDTEEKQVVAEGKEDVGMSEINRYNFYLQNESEGWSVQCGKLEKRKRNINVLKQRDYLINYCIPEYITQHKKACFYRIFNDMGRAHDIISYTEKRSSKKLKYKLIWKSKHALN